MMNYKNNALIENMPALNDCTSWGDDVALIGEYLPKLLKYSDIEKTSDNSTTDLTGAGVLMQNPQGELNLAVYQNKYNKPFTVFDYDNHAIILGDETDEKMAVLGIDNAIALYNERMANTGGACILTLPTSLERQFVMMVNAFNPKYVITTDDKPINTDRTVISHFAPLSIALQSSSFDELLGDSDTAITKEHWGELLPLDGHLMEQNPYPVKAFGKLAGVVQAIAKYAQTPLSMAGNSVLGALSTICQCFVNAPMGYEHKPVSLFLLTESPSGAGKTQVNKLAYKSIYDYDRRNYQAFIDDVKSWQQAKDTLRGKEKAEYFTYHSEPINTALIIKDGSIEKILDRFVKGDVHNQSWATDEAGQFFGGHSMKSDTNANALSSLTSLWSTGTANRQRVGSNTPFTNAYDCRFTLDLAGQRVIIEPAMNDDLMNGQGFLARCLLSCEPSLIGTRDWITKFSPFQDEVLQEYWCRCDTMLEMGQQYDQDGKPNRFNMPFDDEARQVLAQYQQTIEYQQAKGGRLASFTAFASRMAENATRIATILAYYDGKDKLSREYLEQAFLLVEFSINELIYYNDKGGTPTNAQLLLAHLIKKQTDGCLLYSQAQSTAPKSVRKKDEFALAIEVLTGANYIKVKQTDGKRQIVLNPILMA